MATTSFGYENFFSTTLSSSITDSDLTINLNAVPTPSEGVLVIEPDSDTKREVIYYTSKGASSVTCPGVGGRGADGTTATSHSSGATVKMNTTALMFEVLQDMTAVSDTSITTAKLQDDAVTDAKRPRLKAAVVLTTGTTASSASPTALDFTTTDEHDPEDWHDPGGANPSRVTVDEAGAYALHFHSELGSFASGEHCAVYFAKNGTQITNSVSGFTQGDAAGDGYIEITMPFVILAASDYIEVFGEHDGGTFNFRDMRLSVVKLSD